MPSVTWASFVQVSRSTVIENQMVFAVIGWQMFSYSWHYTVKCSYSWIMQNTGHSPLPLTASACPDHHVHWNQCSASLGSLSSDPLPEIKELSLFSFNWSDVKELCLKCSLDWYNHVKTVTPLNDNHINTLCRHNRDKVISVLSGKHSVRTKQFQMLDSIPLNLTLWQCKSLGEPSSQPGS